MKRAMIVLATLALLSLGAASARAEHNWHGNSGYRYGCRPAPSYGCRPNYGYRYGYQFGPSYYGAFRPNYGYPGYGYSTFGRPSCNSGFSFGFYGRGGGLYFGF